MLRSGDGEVMRDVLFLCTGNSARSILAEAYLNAAGKGRFVAYSAGSRPVGAVNPYALELLKRNRLPTEGLCSKSWNEFAAAGAPPLHFVFTVCDQAAGEVCPVWPGQPMTAHWGIDDPAAARGDDEVKRKAFFRAYNELTTRISLFLNLPIEKLDRLTLRRKLDDIGRTSAAQKAREHLGIFARWVCRPRRAIGARSAVGQPFGTRLQARLPAFGTRGKKPHSCA